MTNRVSVSVAWLTGTHPLYLARQIAAKGALAAYYTALPRSRTHGVPPHLVHRHLVVTPLLYAWMKGWSPISTSRLERFIERDFDRWVSRRVVQADVVYALAGAGRRLRQAARERFGALAVCDSPTTHVRYRKALLQAEYARWGRSPMDFNEKQIESIEQELRGKRFDPGALSIRVPEFRGARDSRGKAGLDSLRRGLR